MNSRPANLERQINSMTLRPLAGSNNFTGSIQNTIPSNSVLQLLHVQYNQLTGQLPSSLANAQYLVDLDTSVNNMSGTIPAAIGSIKTLKSFAIVRNNFSGAAFRVCGVCCLLGFLRWAGRELLLRRGGGGGLPLNELLLTDRGNHHLVVDSQLSQTAKRR